MRACICQWHGVRLRRSGDYAAAVTAYTRALALSRSAAGEQRAILLSNRAAASIKLRRWDDAMQDTSAAVQLDPSNLKAHVRGTVAGLAAHRGTPMRITQHVEAATRLMLCERGFPDLFPHDHDNAHVYQVRQRTNQGECGRAPCFGFGHVLHHCTARGMGHTV